jgi:hypothetical protein
MNLVRPLNQVHESPHSGASVQPKRTILVKERTRIDYLRTVNALWHVSEDGSITRFEPRANPDHDSSEPLVWAIDSEHVPAYWFPRDLPRGTFWAIDTTTDEDVERFLTGDRARRVHAIESSWLATLRDARVFAYRLPPETFEPYGRAAGYFVSREAVEPIEVVELADLVGRHADAGIELRIVPELGPLWERVIGSTLEFSGIRLRNLKTRT